MKEKIINYLKIFCIITILTLIVSIPYLNKSNVFAHDISYHLNRMINISKELQNGQFPVLIHTEMLDQFGYANSLFYPEIFLYFPAILILIGIEYLTAYKIMYIFITFFTIIIAYYSSNILFKNKKVSWIITILYGFAYYRLTNTYERGALGEVLAATFLPLIISGSYEIIFGENKKWWILPLGIFGVINSHILSYAMIILVLIVICLINIRRILKDKKIAINLLIAGVVSILLSCSYIFTYLEQINSNQFFIEEITMYDGNFMESYAVTLKELINNTLYKGDFYKSIGIIILILPIFIFKNKNKNEEYKYMKQLFFLGVFLLFATTNLFPWKQVSDKLEFITVLQFPYRLNNIITVLYCFVGGYGLCNILNYKDKFINCAIVILILYNIFFISCFRVEEKNRTIKELIELAPIGSAEYMPNDLYIKDKKVYNIGNKQEINYQRKGTRLEFEYNNKKDNFDIHIPLAYYKGYIAYIENENGKTNIEVTQDEKTKNIILKNEEIITGHVVVEYKMTKNQITGNVITYTTLFLMIIYIIYNTITNNKLINKNIENE